MNADKAVKIALAVIIIISVVAIGFVTQPTTSLDEPRGPMTGEPPAIHPVESSVIEIPMDEMIYVPTSPEHACLMKERIMIDMPIHIVDTDGTDHWYWLYQNRTSIRWV